MADLKHYRKWAKLHPNFMTTDILRLWNLDTYVIELSGGDDFDHKPMFGVTLLKMQGDTYITSYEEGIDKLFRSRAEALNHIETIVKPYVKAKLEAKKYVV